MAQTGYTPILIYASSTPGNTPSAANMTSSASGAELAINYADGKLFYKDSGGTVQVLAVKMPSGILPIANGGTNATATPTAGAVAYGTGTAYAFTSAGTSNQVLISNGSSAPSWSSLSSLGVTSLSFGTTGLTPSTATQGAITVAGTLATTNGGTGLTSFTANGVVYASSTSALTTGSALTYNGTDFVNTAGAIRAGTNSGSGGSLAAWGGATGATIEITPSSASGANGVTYNTSFISGGSGPHIFSIGGSEQMRLTSKALMVGYTSDSGFSGQYNAAFYGSVGIGTSSPASKLDVSAIGAGIQLKQSATGSATYYVMDTTVETGGKRWRFGYSGAAGFSAFSLYNQTDNITSWVADASGNLGLGVTPSAWSLGKAFEIGSAGNSIWSRTAIVEYMSGAYYNSGYKYGNTGNAVCSYQQNSGSHIWYNAPSGTAGNAITFTQAMTLDASGNLALGTTSTPTGQASNNRVIQIYGAGTANRAQIHFCNSDTGETATDGSFIGIDTNKNLFIINREAADTVFENNGSERARIDSSGNWLVGTTSFSATPSQGFAISNATNTYAAIGHANGTASGNYYATFSYNGGLIGSITQNGTTGVLYNLTSDYRLKNNPTALTGAKEFVMALQPKTWDWWDGSGKGVGFIAHEFMEVAKYSGNGEKDAVDAEGNPVYQSIQPSSSEVMANLVALIQEQQAIINTLTARVAALESK